MFALTLPLLLRSLVDIGFQYWFIWPSDDFGEAGYNDIFTILTDYLPVVCQVASLVFGFVRNKQVKFV